MKCLKIPRPGFCHRAIKLTLNMVRTQAWARWNNYPGDRNVQTTMKMTAPHKAGQHAVENSARGVAALGHRHTPVHGDF